MSTTSWWRRRAAVPAPAPNPADHSIGATIAEAARMLENPQLRAAHKAAVAIVDGELAEAAERVRKALLVREMNHLAREVRDDVGEASLKESVLAVHRAAVAIQQGTRPCPVCGQPMQTGIAHYCEACDTRAEHAYKRAMDR
jgi:uncharacterized protein (UPF0212 family)